MQAVLCLRSESDYPGGVIWNMVLGSFPISWPRALAITCGPPQKNTCLAQQF